MLSKDLVAASSKPLLLSILAQQENYGYAIIQRVRELSHNQINWTEGMLYPVLHRLEEEGLVQSAWKAAESGRSRKYYRITANGRRALNHEQSKWLAVHNTLSRLWKTKPAST